MNKKFYLIIGIIIALIVVGIILIYKFIFISIDDGGVETIALKSLDAISDVKNPSALLNEEVKFEIETLSAINPNHVFRLFLPEGVEYISGDFILQNGELILEPFGQLGVNVQREYLGKDAEKWIMKLERTKYSFKVKGVFEGKYKIIVETGSKNKTDKIKPGQWGSISEFFIELRSATFCSAGTLEKAIQLCTQVEAECTTKECIEERTRMETERVD